ncbi:response regulator receiver modulated diguanylate cyclase with PAS/PAC sensor [Kalymmatonema gypsitolerans NIES-4073]|uniref:GGDEF domain-containing response regulator n=1 Tax=Scytonema sp. PRP1 TaxID=3120513 RepID=UPI000B5EFF7F|nr:response regulator receiver modulated diguanylate cyclase with PAS/PAC sensor [Scytonema sp. NIES-4073]
MASQRILVVENEKKIALDIKKRLQKMGYFVYDISSSGEEAIKKVEETNPNLVLVDICLSGTINGAQVADIIIKNFEVPVLYLTDYSKIQTINENRLTEPFSYITKPVTERDMHIAIKMALYKHQTKRKLLEEKRKFLAILKSMGSAVMITDTSGCICMMNPVAEALTAWKQDEAVNKNLTEVLSLVDKDTGLMIKDLTAQVIQTGVVLNLPETLTLITKNYTEIHIGGSIAPIRDDDGNMIGAVLVFQDITQRKLIEAQLVRNAFYDALTGLPNRVLFLERLTQVFERGKRRNNDRYAVLFLDLDGFKKINDSFGHSVGDDLLMEVARRLESCLRSGDTVARFGGDEFAILIEDIKDVTDATNVAKRIQESLKLPLELKEHEILIAASIGIALNSSSYEQPENLLRDADMAMYHAKQQGKARYVVFNSQKSLDTND